MRCGPQVPSSSPSAGTHLPRRGSRPAPTAQPLNARFHRRDGNLGSSAFQELGGTLAPRHNDPNRHTERHQMGPSPQKAKPARETHQCQPEPHHPSRHAPDAGCGTSHGSPTHLEQHPYLPRGVIPARAGSQFTLMTGKGGRKPAKNTNTRPRREQSQAWGEGAWPGTLLTPQAVNSKALELHQRDALRGGLQVELQAVRVQLPPVPRQPPLLQPRSAAGELHLPPAGGRSAPGGRRGKAAGGDRAHAPPTRPLPERPTWPRLPARRGNAEAPTSCRFYHGFPRTASPAHFRHAYPRPPRATPPSRAAIGWRQRSGRGAGKGAQSQDGGAGYVRAGSGGLSEPRRALCGAWPAAPRRLD